MASVRLLPQAEADILEAVAWYEARNPRTAHRFEDAVTAAIDRLGEMPELYAAEGDQHRHCPVRKSRYVVVYRYDPFRDEVVVAAVANPSDDSRRF